jgi:hypothetical protein
MNNAMYVLAPVAPKESPARCDTEHRSPRCDRSGSSRSQHKGVHLSTGIPDHAGWTRGPRGAAEFWSKMGANGVPRGLRMIGAYPGRGVGVKLVKHHSLADQPGWDTPE